MGYIGIDCGKHGAIALIDPETEDTLVCDTPLIGGEYDVRGMVALVEQLSFGIPIHMVGIERQSPRPKKGLVREGVVSSFTSGKGMGMWIGIIAAASFPWVLISPSVWKRTMGLSAEKEEARRRAREMFPLVDLSLKKHHGRAEALLIARYTQQAFQGEKLCNAYG